jgi:phosphatidylglycerol:prolipoprotein diacylglycerol transferase
MFPEILPESGLYIPTYGISFSFSVILGILLCYRRAKLEGLDLDHYTRAVFLGLVGLIVMSKALHVATEWRLYAEDPWGAFDLRRGHAFYGGVIGGIGLPYIYTRFVKERYLTYLDIWLTYSALGLAIHRALGCLGAGCCHGAPTGLPWGITFPAEAPASVRFGPVPVHPTQINESLVFWVAFLFILFWRKHRRKVAGELFAWWLLFSGVGKFLVEMLRGDPGRGFLLSLSTAQWISVGMLAASGALWLHVRKQRRASFPTYN